MRTHRIWANVVGLISVAAFVGCGPAAVVRVETQIEPNGACRRNVYQPREGYAPAEVLTPAWQARWQVVAGTTAKSRTIHPHVPLADQPYFVARGHFQSPGEIPEHYRFVNKDHPEAGASELRRTYRQIDYGFVTQYCWEEQLTNNVTLESFLAARNEFLDLMVPYFVARIERQLDKEYKTEDLAAYVRGDGRRLAEDASLALYDAFAAKVPTQEIIGRLSLATERYGLVLRDPDGQPVSLEQAEKPLERFLHRLIREHLNRRDGKAMTEVEIDQLLNRWNHGSDPALQDPLQSRMETLVLRMLGFYNSLNFLFQGLPQFEFSLELPGELVETNGKLTGAGRAVWKFGGEDLFPGGYTMKATSVTLDTDAQEKLLGRVAIGDRAKALEFVELVGDDGPLVDAVRKAAGAGDRAALDRLPVQSLDDASRVRKLRKLLRLD